MLKSAVRLKLLGRGCCGWTTCSFLPPRLPAAVSSLHSFKPPPPPSQPFVLPPHLQPMGGRLELTKMRLSTSLPRQDEPKDKEEKVGIVKKFKKMFKDYWYVLVPVHVATSVVWYGGFYLLCKSGVDIVGLLEMIGTSETILGHLRSSDAGYYALAYACYKVATPFRYTVTVAGTTATVSKLKDRGLLKSTEVKDKMKDRRADLKEKYVEQKEKMGERREKLKDEWENAWEKYGKRKNN